MFIKITDRSLKKVLANGTFASKSIEWLLRVAFNCISLQKENEKVQVDFGLLELST